ncbi:hypothetical protein FQY83_04185 [Luteimonas marina]|uniref:Uncharacterized protein n=1 Tax=Luteimonas marina TaxID=488485 RepID=A0A5C5U8F0_9GAMM|nr:hypothetical protein [Luteimonas marina]TWT22239.1 hypothetical protein FQY83_04185 [Luteimonas marina]
MRLVVFATSLLMVAPALAQTRVEKPTLLKPQAPFTESGVVSESEMKLISTIEVNKIEEGAHNGVAYRIYYTDGSGSFSGSPDGKLSGALGRGSDWSTACKKDPMNDKKSCYLQRNKLWVWLYQTGRVEVFIGGDQYPGTSATIRIDSNPAIKSPSDSEGVFTAAQSKQIVQQLISGDTVATRYVDWPYRSANDDSFGLSGFDEAYEYIQWALKQIK